MEKVYCKKCKWLKTKFWFVEPFVVKFGTYCCENPNNVKPDTFLKEGVPGFKSLKEINKDNDCKWFEPLSLIGKIKNNTFFNNPLIVPLIIYFLGVILTILFVK